MLGLKLLPGNKMSSVWELYYVTVESNCRHDFPHKGQSRGALMFSLICAWTSGWVNNRDAGDLRRHHVHYDVTVMLTPPATVKPWQHDALSWSKQYCIAHHWNHDIGCQNRVGIDLMLATCQNLSITAQWWPVVACLPGRQPIRFPWWLHDIGTLSAFIRHHCIIP